KKDGIAGPKTLDALFERAKIIKTVRLIREDSGQEAASAPNPRMPSGPARPRVDPPPPSSPPPDWDGVFQDPVRQWRRREPWRDLREFFGSNTWRVSRPKKLSLDQHRPHGRGEFFSQQWFGVDVANAFEVEFHKEEQRMITEVETTSEVSMA